MVSVNSNLQLQDIDSPRQIWVSRWSDSDGLPRFKAFATQEEAIQHLLEAILPRNNYHYFETLFASETVRGGINRGEIDLRLII
jgi:hypothetical protein